MSSMPYRRFIAWAAPAAVIWAVAYVSIGTFAGAAFRTLLVSGMHYAGYVLAGLVIVFFFVVWIVKRRLARTEGPEADADGDGRIDLDVRDDEPV